MLFRFRSQQQFHNISFIMFFICAFIQHTKHIDFTHSMGTEYNFYFIWLTITLHVCFLLSHRPEPQSIKLLNHSLKINRNLLHEYLLLYINIESKPKRSKFWIWIIYFCVFSMNQIFVSISFYSDYQLCLAGSELFSQVHW